MTAASNESIDEVRTELARIAAFGSLDFTITDMKMHGTTTEDVAFDWVEFEVTATWPADYRPTRP